MKPVVKNAQSAIYELLGRFDGTPEAAAEATRTFEGIAGYDAAADVRLMVLLHDLASNAATAQSLALLKGLSDGAKVLRGLSRALAEGDPERRQAFGKKLAGEALRFHEQHLRRRADAVEALFGSDTPEVREVLWELARSEGNRVAANALLALYWLSDTRVFAEFRQMALHPDRRHRASAVWAIGKTGDQRFSELLLKLLEDPEPALRRAAFGVMRAIKESLSRVTAAPALRVKILDVQSNGEARRAWIGATQADGRPAPELPSRAFIVRENGAPVEGYEVERIRPAAAVNFGVLAVAARGQKEPEFAAAEQGIAQLLDHKRAEDPCALLKLRSGGSGAPVAALEVALVTQTWILRRIGAQPMHVMDVPGLAGAAGLRRLIEELQPASGPRHILCCFPSPADAPADAGAIAAEAAAAGIAIHVIAAGDEPPASACIELARGTSGVILPARTPAAVREAWRLLYHAIIGGYVVRWRAAGAPGAVSVRLSTGAATGTAVWPDTVPAAVAA